MVTSPERVLVTGGAGFIGTLLSHALVSAGYRLTVLDNFSTGKLSEVSDLLDSIHNVQIVRGHCKSAKDLRKALFDTRVVFHLAGNPEVRPDRSPPSAWFDENIQATYTLLEEVRRSETEIIVF